MIIVGALPFGFWLLIALIGFFSPSEFTMSPNKFIWLRSSKFAFLRNLGWLLYYIFEAICNFQLFMLKVIAFLIQASFWSFCIYIVWGLYKIYVLHDPKP